MIRINDIKESLLHLIGWQQNYDTSELKIADYLTQSDSGMYYQQIHPLLTLQNLASIAPDFKNIQFPEYEENKYYQKGNVVKYNAELYISLKDTRGVQPGDEDVWQKTDLFSEWLKSKTEASIIKAVTRFNNDKSAAGTSKPLCENKILFEGAGRIIDTVKNRNQLVGFEIVPIRSKGVTVRIDKIGLQFTQPGEYRIYVMHSDMDEPVKTLTLTKTKSNSVEWFSFKDLYLPYQSDLNGAGGSWYLVYEQSELPNGSMAIQKEKDWSKEPCGSCSRREKISWMAWSKFIEIHPFFISEEEISNDNGSLKMWDVERNQYTYNNNYGLNLEVSVLCDYTDFIIEQKELFQDVIAKQTAADLLREFAYNANVRTNRHSINASRIDILYEIDGDSSSMKKSGLGYQIELAYKALNINTNGIDRICLPCKNNGVKYRTI
ncbi:MAG: hypothetical protein ACI4IS_01155 [Acutalibacteraceae bacterium]